MGDLNLLTQLSTCFVLFCDWRIGTHQFSLHTLCFRFLLQLEVINISEYLTTQTPLPPFLPYPRFLLELDLSQTAKMTYALLLDRATLSQKNLWTDAEENCSFPDFSLCGVSGSDGKVAANPVQLCSCAVDALHLRLRHLHCLPSDLESVPYLAGSRIPLLCPLFRRNYHHRGHRAVQ